MGKRKALGPPFSDAYSLDYSPHYRETHLQFREKIRRFVDKHLSSRYVDKCNSAFFFLEEFSEQRKALLDGMRTTRFRALFEKFAFSRNKLFFLSFLKLSDHVTLVGYFFEGTV